MIRKALLVGCNQSPWVRVQDDYANARVSVKAPEGTELELETHEEFKYSKFATVGPGTHLIEPGITFVRVRVLKGDPLKMLCFLLAEAPNAVQST